MKSLTCSTHKALISKQQKQAFPKQTSLFFPSNKNNNKINKVYFYSINNNSYILKKTFTSNLLSSSATSLSSLLEEKLKKSKNRKFLREEQQDDNNNEGNEQEPKRNILLRIEQEDRIEMDKYLNIFQIKFYNLNIDENIYLKDFIFCKENLQDLSTIFIKFKYLEKKDYNLFFLNCLNILKDKNFKLKFPEVYYTKAIFNSINKIFEDSKKVDCLQNYLHILLFCKQIDKNEILKIYKTYFKTFVTEKVQHTTNDFILFLNDFLKYSIENNIDIEPFTKSSILNFMIKNKVYNEETIQIMISEVKTEKEFIQVVKEIMKPYFVPNNSFLLENKENNLDNDGKQQLKPQPHQKQQQQQVMQQELKKQQIIDDMNEDINIFEQKKKTTTSEKSGSKHHRHSHKHSSHQEHVTTIETPTKITMNSSNNSIAISTKLKELNITKILNPNQFILIFNEILKKAINLKMIDIEKFLENFENINFTNETYCILVNYFTTMDSNVNLEMANKYFKKLNLNENVNLYLLEEYLILTKNYLLYLELCCKEGIDNYLTKKEKLMELSIYEYFNYLKDKDINYNDLFIKLFNIFPKKEIYLLKHFINDFTSSDNFKMLQSFLNIVKKDEILFIECLNLIKNKIPKENLKILKINNTTLQQNNNITLQNSIKHELYHIFSEIKNINFKNYESFLYFFKNLKIPKFLRIELFNQMETILFKNFTKNENFKIYEYLSNEFSKIKKFIFSFYLKLLVGSNLTFDFINEILEQNLQDKIELNSDIFNLILKEFLNDREKCSLFINKMVLNLETFPNIDSFKIFCEFYYKYGEIENAIILCKNFNFYNFLINIYCKENIFGGDLENLLQLNYLNLTYENFINLFHFYLNNKNTNKFLFYFNQFINLNLNLNEEIVTFIFDKLPPKGAIKNLEIQKNLFEKLLKNSNYKNVENIVTFCYLKNLIYLDLKELKTYFKEVYKFLQLKEIDFTKNHILFYLTILILKIKDYKLLQKLITEYNIYNIDIFNGILITFLQNYYYTGCWTFYRSIYNSDKMKLNYLTLMILISSCKDYNDFYEINLLFDEVFNVSKNNVLLNIDSVKMNEEYITFYNYFNNFPLNFSVCLNKYLALTCIFSPDRICGVLEILKHFKITIYKSVMSNVKRRLRKLNREDVIDEIKELPQNKEWLDIINELDGRKEEENEESSSEQKYASSPSFKEDDFAINKKEEEEQVWKQEGAAIDLEQFFK